MNFNQGPNPPNQNPPMGDPRSMLPPQFQKLSARQLQELQKQPQFQNMLRQYYQRQQLLQQQMAGQQGMRQGSPGSVPQGMPQNRNPAMQNPAQNMPAGNMNPGMGASGGMPQGGRPATQTNLAQQQMYNRNAQAAYLQQQRQQQMQSAQRSQGSYPSGQAGPQMGGMAHPGMAAGQRLQGALAGKPGPPPPGFAQPPNGYLTDSQSNEAAAAVASAAAAAAISAGSREAAPNGAPPAGRHGSVMQQIADPLSSGLYKEPVKIPPSFAPDSASRVPLSRMKSVNEWSEKLREQGEEVPLDLRLFEDIVKKDSDYVRRVHLQAQDNKELLERMSRDIKSYNAIKQLRMNAISTSAKNQFNNSIWGEGYQGYGNGISNTATQVILPSKNKSFSKVPPLPYTDAELNEIVLQADKASQGKDLVPIRLDFDSEKDRFKLRDTFLWNLNEEAVPIETFVKTLIEDYKFISESHYENILHSVKEQIKDYRKKPEKTMGEIRIPIKIDILINDTQYTDQFEWDILNFKDNDPEDFAAVLCDEMSLPGEFATAIAFSIREQTQMYHKALFLVGYSFDGSAIREEEIRSNLAPPLRVLNPAATNTQGEDFITTLRNPSSVSDYSPSLNKLSQSEIEKIDKEMERESRRRRRHFNNESSFSYNENGPNSFGGSGRGTASRRSALHTGRGVKTTLPDLSEIPKTFRTPMPSSILPGGIDLGVPEIYGYNELIVNRTQVANPDYKPVAPPGMVTFWQDTAGSFFVKIKRRRQNGM